MLMDNTKAKHGKFKSFLIWLSIPSIIFICFIPYVPLSWINITVFYILGERVSQAALFIFLLHVLISFTYPVSLVAYNGLGQTITPNTVERAKVFSFQPIILGLWGSIIGIIFPILATITKQSSSTGQENLLSYRVFFPIFGIISFLLILLVYHNVQERLIVEKDYKPKVKFWHGLKSLGTNKYLWLVNIGSALTSIKIATNIVQWINIYSLKSDYATSITTLLMGNVLIPGMVLTGFLVKKFGKRNLMLASGFTQTVLYIPMILFPSRPYLLLIIIIIQNFALGFATCFVIMPADALDYQQLKTGERLEGFYGNFNQLMVGITILIAGLIVPLILAVSGMPDGADVLKINSIRYAVFSNINIFSMIVTFLATLPYLFWDLSEKKHHEIILQLEKIAKEKNNSPQI